MGIVKKEKQKVRGVYLQKLELVRNGQFIKIKDIEDFKNRYAK